MRASPGTSPGDKERSQPCPGAERSCSEEDKNWGGDTAGRRWDWASRDWQFIKWASLVAQLVKNPPAMKETWVRSLGWEDTLGEDMETHSSPIVLSTEPCPH